MIHGPKELSMSGKVSFLKIMSVGSYLQLSSVDSSVIFCFPSVTRYWVLLLNC